LRARLGKVSRDRPRWGYRRAHALLLEEGWCLNRKRTQRLWREEGLRVPQRRRKRQRLGELAGSGQLESTCPSWNSLSRGDYQP